MPRKATQVSHGLRTTHRLTLGTNRNAEETASVKRSMAATRVKTLRTKTRRTAASANAGANDAACAYPAKGRGCGSSSSPPGRWATTVGGAGSTVTNVAVGGARAS